MFSIEGISLSTTVYKILWLITTLYYYKILNRSFQTVLICFNLIKLFFIIKNMLDSIFILFCSVLILLIDILFKVNFPNKFISVMYTKSRNKLAKSCLIFLRQQLVYLRWLTKSVLLSYNFKITYRDI